jgi:predicted nucleotidyltransferase
VPIPEFVDNVLPEGVYDCTLDEVRERFGRFQKSDSRLKLTDKLDQYLKAAKFSGIIVAVVVDGSYTTAKEEPEDIDLLISLDPDFDFTQELKPYQENAIDKKAIKREYKFDSFSLLDSSVEYREKLEFFQDVPPKHSSWTSQLRKGVLRITL